MDAKDAHHLSRGKGHLTRRQLAVIVALPAMAQTPAPNPAKPSDDKQELLEFARQHGQRNWQQMKRAELSIFTEPSFSFRAL